MSAPTLQWGNRRPSGVGAPSPMIPKQVEEQDYFTATPKKASGQGSLQTGGNTSLFSHLSNFMFTETLKS